MSSKDNRKGCELCVHTVKNGSEKTLFITQFKCKFESQKNACAVLIVKDFSNATKQWVIAGYNDSGKFVTVLIDNINDELAIELERAEVPNRARLIMLALSYLGRTHRKDLSVKQNFDEFCFIREEIRGQHAMISDRMSWFAIFQTFLFTAFATVATNQDLRWFSVFLLPIIGVVSSVLLYLAIISACERIHTLRKKIQDYEHDDVYPLNTECYHRVSLLYPRCLPCIFFLSWLVVFFCSDGISSLAKIICAFYEERLGLI